MITLDDIRELADPAHTGLVLSVHLRTDPRDPANTNHVPGWLIALRNGLREVAQALEAHGTRPQRLGFRELSRKAEDELSELEPGQRGRGISWFLSLEDGLDRRFTLQLPPREHTVRIDRRPFISPLVDVADRGRPTGLVLVSPGLVRLLHWQAGRVEEPADSVYELALGDWRHYAGYAAANPARGQQTATHVESYRQRVEDHRRRFLEDAAAATARRLDDLGWDRVVVAADGQVATDFERALPPAAARRVVGVVEANLTGAAPADVASRLEEDLEQAWRREAERGLDEVVAHVAADGPGALGVAPTLEVLAVGRVARLFLDPLAELTLAGVPDHVADALGRPGADLAAERCVERALAAGAEVTALPDGPDALHRAGAIAALLRY